MTQDSPNAGGTREFLRIALPLAASTGTMSLMMVTDRAFLMQHSVDAMAASMPGGMLSWTLTSFFFGTVNYLNVFVAQYYGSGRPERIGACVWQGVFISLVSSLFFVPAIIYADRFFHGVGYTPNVATLATDYFRILGWGVAPALLNCALSCIYSGRGKNLPVFFVNLAAMLFNFVADYALIFGHFGMPEMGVRGAALATISSSTLSVVLWVIILCVDESVRPFALLKNCRPDLDLLKRILRFGSLNGLTMFLEAVLFNVFLAFVGRMGTAEIAATNIAFTLNTLSFIPMIGFMFALETLVGRRIGEGRPDLAEKTTWTAVKLCSYYMAVWVVIFLFFPQLILWIFEQSEEVSRMDADNLAKVREYAHVLLRFVAAYTVFDGLQLMFGGAIRGAGDTRFSLLLWIGSELMFLIAPVSISVVYFDAGLYTVWVWVTLWVVVLSLGFFLRFQQGHWKSMKVIESAPEGLTTVLPTEPAEPLAASRS